MTTQEKSKLYELIKSEFGLMEKIVGEVKKSRSTVYRTLTGETKNRSLLEHISKVVKAHKKQAHLTVEATRRNIETAQQLSATI